MDFTNDWGILDSSYSSSIQEFVSFCHLAPVLGDVLDTLYSIGTTSATIVEMADRATKKLQDWSSEHIFVAIPRNNSPNGWSFPNCSGYQ